MQRAIPFHPQAWRASARVAALPPAARAGYLDVLLALYDEPDGALPADDAILRAAARLPAPDWARHREAILALLDRTPDGRLTHHRVQAELAAMRAAAARAEQRRRAGRTGAAARWNNQQESHAVAMRPQCDRIATALRPHGEHEANADAENAPESAYSDAPTPSSGEGKNQTPFYIPPNPPFSSPFRQGISAQHPPETPVGACEDAWVWFDELCRLWPSRSGHFAARGRWGDLIATRPDFPRLAERILAAARTVAEAKLAPTEVAFLPNLRNFLADERWHDDWPAEIELLRARCSRNGRPPRESDDDAAKRVALQIIARRRQA